MNKNTTLSNNMNICQKT